MSERQRRKLMWFIVRHQGAYFCNAEIVGDYSHIVSVAPNGKKLLISMLGKSIVGRTPRVDFELVVNRADDYLNNFVLLRDKFLGKEFNFDLVRDMRNRSGWHNKEIAKGG